MSAVEKLDRFCALGILATVLFILAWGPLVFGAVQVGHELGEAKHLYGFLTMQGLVVLALGLWVVRIFIQRPFRLLWPPMCWAVVAFLLYAIVRCQFVVVEFAARRELMNVALYAALFFLVVNNLNRRESAWAVAVVLMAMGLGESLFAFYQYASHNPRVWQLYKPAYYALRGSGTYISPNSFAGFADMVLPLALAYTVMGRLSATLKVLTGYSALVIMAGVLVSESRGGVLAMAVSLLAFCLFLLSQRDYWRQGLLVMGVLLVATIVLMQQFGAVSDRFEKLLTEKGDERAIYWKGAEQIFHQHLVWGAGPGHFKYLFPRYVEYRGDYGQSFPQTAHNDYLNTLCEWGLAGFALVMAAIGLLYAGIWQFWPYVKRTSNELERKHSSKAAFVIGAALGLLAVLVHSVVDFDMHVPANAIAAIVLMALLTAHWRFGTEGYWVNPRKIGKALLVVTLLGGAGYLTVAGMRAGKEFYWLDRSEMAKITLEEQRVDFKKAHDLESRDYLPLYQLGESYRVLAWQGNADYKAQTTEAMKWLEDAMILNPYDPLVCVRYAMCLDWLDRHEEATRYFLRANELNPYNAVVSLYYGKHCLELGDYALAAHWFEQSLIFAHGGEGVVYYKVAMERLSQAAKGIPLP